jgi:hypothetical protein
MTNKLQEKYVDFARRIARVELPKKPLDSKKLLLELIVAAEFLDREYRDLSAT